jgi:queuine tRNA-ribosyltransferase
VQNFKFTVQKKSKTSLARAGFLETLHGVIETPAFVAVGTKATVKALTPEMVASLGVSVVLANTYHLYLQPGDELIKEANGLSSFMNWPGPTMTDSGGFQIFSLGAAYGEGGVSKFVGGKKEATKEKSDYEKPTVKLAKIDEEGVTFQSHLDGSFHRFTPERSIQIQHNLGADIIFAFDECTSPLASYDYQNIAMERTHRWAKRSLDEHQRLGGNQSLFGIVQGGRHRDLREKSAQVISQMDFAGFGIGGSFNKKDMGTAVSWVNQILPEAKPRHLLGIGEPEDIVAGIKNGADTFDCVTPTRMARNGTLMVRGGRLNILNAAYRQDLRPIEKSCGCYTCQNYSRAYLAHLFRAKEMLAATLASIHNLYYLVNLVKEIRRGILNDQF